MKIREVKVHCAPMSFSWLTETVIANPMSVYTEYHDKRSSWYGTMTAAVVEIVSDEGISGLGFIGGGRGRIAAELIRDQFQQLLIGKDPFDIELLWEQMFRVSQPYGRKGLAIEALSGVDLALWDLMGKALAQPVYQLVGGKTKRKIRTYVTGNTPERYVQEGFSGVKLALPHGPADGAEGLRKNEELVRHTREVVGPDADIMLDCYMALDVPYTIQLAHRLRDYGLRWIEEPVPPDQVDNYRRIKDALPDLLLAGGEHEFTRYGFKELIEKKAVDVLQPDIYRAGGMSELKKIAAMASAYGLPVVPHGVGAPTYHFVISTNNSPVAEYVDIFAQGGELLLENEPLPKQGFIEISDEPGFGYRLNPRAFRGEARIAPIW